jgi:hypothetical protein
MPELSERWLEVNIKPNEEFDRELLFGVVEPLVHEHFKSDLECWFFFWEPDLRLRLRWRDPAQSDELSARVFASLERSEAEGRFKGWYEGSHGRAGERYSGEAGTYGEKEWELHQKDWMSGSELALLLLRLDHDGLFSGTEFNTLDSHWSRRVHLFTNQTYGSWNAEIALCLAQARGYLGNLLALAPQDPLYTRVYRNVDEALRLLSRNDA